MCIRDRSEIDAEAKRLETEMKTAYCKVVEAMGVNCKAHLQGTAAVSYTHLTQIPEREVRNPGEDNPP